MNKFIFLAFFLIFAAGGCSSGNRIEFENGQFDILVQNIDAYELITDMAAKNGLKADISEKAQKILKEETVSLDAEEAKTDETVQAVLYGLDLVYIKNETGFSIKAVDEDDNAAEETAQTDESGKIAIINVDPKIPNQTPQAMPTPASANQTTQTASPEPAKAALPAAQQETAASK